MGFYFNTNSITPSKGGGGGGSAVIDELNVTPTTSAQTITAPSGTDGYSPVNVSAVTSGIDANISAGNIKSGVTILGVTGNYNGSGYSEVPSYQIVNGVISRRNGALTGNEFTGVTSIANFGLYNAFNSCTNLTGTIDLSSITNIGQDGMNSAFYDCTGLTGTIDLSSVTLIGQNGLNRAFSGCTGLTGILLSNLETIINASSCYGLCQSCSNITTVSFPKLTTVSGYNGCNYMFSNCSNLSSVSLPEFEVISGDSGCQNMFNNCTSLTSISFPKLTILSGKACMQQMFGGCKALTDVYFNALKTTSFFGYLNQFGNNLLQSTGTNVTHTLHFPSNLQSTIQNLTGYPLFGGTSGYVTLSFDLPATE